VMLRWVLSHQLFMLGVTVGVAVLNVYLFVIIPKGFFPQQDTGLALGITEAAEDVSPGGMAAIQRQVIGTILADPAVASVGAYIGAGGATSTENQGRLFIALKPRNARPPIDTIMARITAATRKLVGVDVFLQAVQDVNIGGRLTAAQYQYTLTDVDLAELDQWAPRLLAALRKLPEIADVASDQQAAGPQLVLHIDRQTASRLGVSAAEIDAVLYDAFGQRPISQLYTNLNQYYVIMETQPELQLGPDALRRIYVASQTHGMVPLSEVVTRQATTAPLSVNHQGQFPSVTLSFNLRPGQQLGTAVNAIRHAMVDLHMPGSIQASFQGNAQAFQSSLSSTPILILAALIAVYIILGMLYENIIHPLTILSTLPSAGVGALLVLDAFGYGLDVIGIIGIILLIGIVKKNGIMLVDFALHAERELHVPPEQAIRQACVLRLRPILMTTMCALLGGLPLMLSNGTGSELRKPLGVAIVGGLIVSQVLTLFTTPVIYLYMGRLAALGGWLRERRPAPPKPEPARVPSG